MRLFAILMALATVFLLPVGDAGAKVRNAVRSLNPSTDLSIPNGMGGVKAIAEIRQTDPEVVAIVSSGYSDDPAMADPEKYGYAAVLPKPYQPNELTNLVDLILKGG